MRNIGKRILVAVLLAAVMLVIPSCWKNDVTDLISVEFGKDITNPTPGKYELNHYSYTKLENDVYVIKQINNFGLEISSVEMLSMRDYEQESSYMGLKIHLLKCERDISVEALFYKPVKTEYTRENADYHFEEEVHKDSGVIGCYASGEGTKLPFTNGYDVILLIDDVPVLYAKDVHESDGMGVCAMKPVIYLYPEEPLDVNVKLDFDGELICTYPKYNEGGWQVKSYPDGTLVDESAGRSYDYLFWEGDIRQAEWDKNEYFCVAGSETAAFLEEYLEAAGLNASETDDFVSFWLPRMQGNSYNIIYFQTSAYEKIAELTIDPIPDTLIRVYMVFEPSLERIESTGVMPSTPSREGFTAVEWGGSDMSADF